MDEFLILAFLLLLVVLPVWAIVRIVVTSRRVRVLEGRVTELENRLFDAWGKKASGTAASAGADQPEPSREPARPAPPLSPEPPRPSRPAQPPQPPPREIPRESVWGEGPPPLPSEEASPAQAAATGERKGRSWAGLEQFMGVKLFAWLGGFALFLGVALFVKYSFDRGLIAPEVQVAAGFLAGLALVVGGLLVPRARFAVTAQTLCATGVVSLYAVTYAARAIYGFAWFGQGTTFALMAGITAGAFLLAVRLDARVVAVLGILGGFLTPALFPSEEKSAFALFGYATLLDMGLMAVALSRRWASNVLLGAAGTVCLGVAWVVAAVEPAHPGATAVAAGWFAALFAAFLLVGARRGLPLRPLGAASAGMAFAAMAFCFWMVLFPDAGRQAGVFFGLLFWADLALLTMAWAGPGFAGFHRWGGLVVFALAGLWVARYGRGELMGWGLGASVALAVLHSLVPAVLARRMPDLVPRSKLQAAFPALSLVLVLFPAAAPGTGAWGFWPAVLAIDLVAFALAALTASALVLGGALVLTLAVALAAVSGMPSGSAVGPVLVAAGFGLFFWLAGFATRKRVVPEGGSGGALAPAGGVLMPFVLLLAAVGRGGVEDPSGVFGAALLLGGLAFAGSRFFKADWMIPSALAGTALLEFAWHQRHFDPAEPWPALAWYLLFAAVYGGYPFVFRREIGGALAPFAAAAAAWPAHFFQVLDGVKRAWPGFPLPGLLALAFAVPSALALRWAIRRGAEEKRLPALFAAAALFFLIVAVPVQFGKEWITVGWALEGLSLVWLWRRIPHPGLRAAGAALLFAAFARLALNPEIRDYHPRGELPVLNWYLYAFGLVSAAFFVAGRWARTPGGGHWLSRLFFAMGWVLAFMLLNIEIADFFGKPGEGLSLEFGGNFARDMAYSVGWGIFALAMLGAGIRFRSAAGRYAALGLLAVSALKVFLHDMARLDALYRIGALIGLAFAAIVASLLYQRFMKPEEKS